MRFDVEMDRRLTNWARWRMLREDGGSIPTATLGERVDCEGWDAPTVIGILEAEAEETQRGVNVMESVIRYAVEAWYLTSGGVAQRCKRAHVSETEMRRRVALGQRALGQWLHDKREAAEKERRRVEALQRVGVTG